MRKIVTIYAFRGHTVSTDPLTDRGSALPAALVGVNRVLVVLADKENGQALQDREVQALGKDAFFSRAVAEKAGHDGVPAAATIVDLSLRERKPLAEREAYVV